MGHVARIGEMKNEITEGKRPRRRPLCGLEGHIKMILRGRMLIRVPARSKAVLAAWILGSRVRIPLMAWIVVVVVQFKVLFQELYT
jgi:hypothetical protein